jgi:hypothetical protein
VIRLRRNRSDATIPDVFRGPGRLVTERALLELRAAGKDPSSSVWKKAKDQLKAESAGKCAYCEGKADHVAFNDVEHFRPKSDYWWLAYCWENYTYSCVLCNQKFKKAKFPATGTHLVPPALPATPTPQQIEALVGTLGPDPLTDVEVKAYRKSLKAERAALPDPYDPGLNPEQLFTWFADPIIGEVEIRARGNGARAKAAIAAVNEFLGLNRQELKGWRWVTWSFAAAFIATLKEPALTPATRAIVEEQLKKMMSDQGEFAAMVRYVVHDVNGLQL